MQNYFQKLLMLLVILLLTGCGARSLDDFEEEGEGVVRSLVQELQEIHTREQLLAATGTIRRHFDRLVDIMIAAQEYRKSNPEIDRNELLRANHELSDQLSIELNRLYKLDGGIQIIEKCQEKGLHKLDIYRS